MRLLLDHDVYSATICFLRELGHDVVTASEIGYSRATDLELLQMAGEQARIFVTRDRDFGGLVFVRGLEIGVIYMRTLPSTLTETHQRLQEVLANYSEDELKSAFIVVEPGRYRFRKLSS